MNLLFRAIVGSQAYGTSTPESDIDYKGIFASDLKEVDPLWVNELLLGIRHDLV